MLLQERGAVVSICATAGHYYPISPSRGRHASLVRPHSVHPHQCHLLQSTKSRSLPFQFWKSKKSTNQDNLATKWFTRFLKLAHIVRDPCSSPGLASSNCTLFLIGAQRSWSCVFHTDFKSIELQVPWTLLLIGAQRSVSVNGGDKSGKLQRTHFGRLLARLSTISSSSSSTPKTSLPSQTFLSKTKWELFETNWKS